MKTRKKYIYTKARKAHIARLNKLNHERRKEKDLPMGVYRFDIDKSKKKFRVCKQIRGKVVTVGYYNTVEAAKKAARIL